MKLIIDKEKHLVIKNDEEFSLPKKEFMVLDLLCSVPGNVYSRKMIYDKVWQHESKSNERTVDVHIFNLRKKFGSEIIRTIKGVGYKCTCEAKILGTS